MTTTSVLFPSAESGFKCESILRKLFLENELTFLPMDVETFPISLYLSNMPEHTYERCIVEDTSSYTASFSFSFYCKSKTEFTDLFSIYATHLFMALNESAKALDVNIFDKKYVEYLRKAIQSFHELAVKSPPLFLALSFDVNDNVRAYVFSRIIFSTDTLSEGVITFEAILAKGKANELIGQFIKTESDDSLTSAFLTCTKKSLLN